MSKTSTSPLPAIPVFDLGTGAPIELMAAARERLDDMLDCAAHLTPRPVMALGDRRSRRWLERAGSPYLDETAAVAEALGRAGGWFLNINYEWACTAGVAQAPDGAGNRLIRVLDWRMTGLGRNLIAARRESGAGPWIDLTWPGFTGVMQALAPGRFAASINQAPLRRHTGLLVLDWLAARREVAGRRALPPAHLLRLAFETAGSYGEAKALLSETPIALPVIFTLCGSAEGEGCVIERLEDRAFVRPAPVATANHWIAADERARPRGDVSAERCDLLAASQAAAGADFAWLKPPILNPTTRLAMMAAPATGGLLAQGFEAGTAVTRITDLSAGQESERAAEAAG